MRLSKAPSTALQEQQQHRESDQEAPRRDGDFVKPSRVVRPAKKKDGKENEEQGAEVEEEDLSTRRV